MYVYFDVDQQDDLRPVMKDASKAADAGAMGVVLAQVFPDHMKVRFIPHEAAKAIQAILAGIKDEEPTP